LKEFPKRGTWAFKGEGFWLFAKLHVREATNIKSVTPKINESPLFSIQLEESIHII